MYLTGADQLGGLQQAVPEIALGKRAPWRGRGVILLRWPRRSGPANRLSRCRSAALGVRGLLEVGFEDAAE